MLPEALFFAEDYLREFAWQDRRFMMELLAPSLQRATGLPLGPLIDTVRDRQALAAFRALAPGSWEQHTSRLPEGAATWLGRRLSPGACIISYEMPRWLAVFLDERCIPWVDIRLSPLRFSCDLMLAVRSSDSSAMLRLSAGEIPRSRLHQEAIKMGASTRRLLRLREPEGEACYDNSLIFVGQTAEDASLLRADGVRLTVADFARELQALARERKQVLYHPHPYAGRHAGAERQALSNMLGHDVQMTRCGTSELLSIDADILLAGISSGLLQEAALFGRAASILHCPVCPLDGAGGYAQYYVGDVMNPNFWATALLSGAREFRSQIGCPDELRRLHALWFTHDRYLLERGPSPLRHPQLAGELEQADQRLTELEACCLRLSGSWLYRAVTWGWRATHWRKR